MARDFLLKANEGKKKKSTLPTTGPTVTATMRSSKKKETTRRGFVCARHKQHKSELQDFATNIHQRISILRSLEFTHCFQVQIPKRLLQHTLGVLFHERNDPMMEWGGLMIINQKMSSRTAVDINFNANGACRLPKQVLYAFASSGGMTSSSVPWTFYSLNIWNKRQSRGWNARNNIGATLFMPTRDISVAWSSRRSALFTFNSFLSPLERHSSMR